MKSLIFINGTMDESKTVTSAKEMRSADEQFKTKLNMCNLLKVITEQADNTIYSHKRCNYV